VFLLICNSGGNALPLPALVRDVGCCYKCLYVA